MAFYSYLEDKAFLKAFDCESYKEQFLKITVLDFKKENPIASIEGVATSGNCNLSGTSNMRRTASCSLIVLPNGISRIGYTTPVQYGNITDVENLISMNKKIKIETGFTNTLKYDQTWSKYSHYDKIWFPIGVFVIKAASVSKNNSGINISLTLNDKCALLNGDMGGMIPAATILSEVDEYDQTGTIRTTSKLLIKDIIRNLVVEFGGENPNNVFITGVDDYAMKIIKWSGRETLYLCESDQYSKLYTTNIAEIPEDGLLSTFTYGQDIGYSLEPFVYPGTLECKAGDTVATMLDKIKNTLGNFEWFYDVDGRFHFQEIKNYLNRSIVTDINKLSGKDYLDESNIFTFDKSVYVFDQNNRILLTSISHAPQYANIKNDFTVWGSTKTGPGESKPIRYHVAFASKPTVSTTNQRSGLIYTDYRGLKVVKPLLGNGKDRKDQSGNYIIGIPDKEKSDRTKFYIEIDNEDPSIGKVWVWDQEFQNFRTAPEYTYINKLIVEKDDWRTELYYQGLFGGKQVYADNPYISELLSEWPKICDLETGKLRSDQTSYDYWLDFIEGDGISPFSIDNIGRRAKVVTDNNSNCLFAKAPPNYYIVEADGDVAKEIEGIEARGAEIIQVEPSLYKHMSMGGSQNPAFDKIKELITQFTSYNETVNISVLPIYHLEPNMRITIADLDIGINGDYLIKTISLPLTPNGTSNISAVRCLEKTI